MSQQSAIEQPIDDGRALEGARRHPLRRSGLALFSPRPVARHAGTRAVPSSRTRFRRPTFTPSAALKGDFPARRRQGVRAGPQGLDTAGKTDHEAFHAVLALRENRYLA